ncbi:hypothetical protein CLV25_105101 [Acetobacteroides hydrogenigenes]|uniref:Uncharacterized protein n=1 Tax=Acetobacteroides hydrogenigenes TaxID=979970 RepID=A0A4R2EW47_9BACT|nr:hypothetical protein CLV25_105101 [Acetobacteroides hydrogenigenes]
MIKGLETLSYFSLIVFIFFKINYFVSFRTIDTCLYENCKRKITHNILGQSIYKVYIYDHQWDDWSSSGWVHVDSATYYGARNFIKINYNMGIFGFKIIPKNQKNK